MKKHRRQESDEHEHAGLPNRECDLSRGQRLSKFPLVAKKRILAGSPILRNHTLVCKLNHPPIIGAHLGVAGNELHRFQRLWFIQPYSARPMSEPLTCVILRLAADNSYQQRRTPIDEEWREPVSLYIASLISMVAVVPIYRSTHANGPPTNKLI